MAALKKKETEEFRIPSLAESSQEYNGLIVKRQGLHERYLALNAESNKLRGEIEKAKAAGAKPLSPSVAALLGDAPDSLTLLSKRLREVSAEMNDIEAAQEILRRRIEEARNGASKAVCDAVRGEYQRRLGALCGAAKALEAARQSHDELIDAIEREDVNLAYLKPVHPFFMGDRREGKVHYFLKEVAESHNV